MADDLVPIKKWTDIAPLIGSGAISMPYSRDIFLLDCPIAGTGYVEDIVSRTENLLPDAVVSLIREPANKYDELAVRVDDEKGEKLGYIPRKKNEVLARLLDGGKMLYGKVTETKISDHGNWVGITVKIFMRDL